MTLDNGIKRCIERAEIWESGQQDETSQANAEEQRQLAEWLKELKLYRETYPYGVR